jgi:LAO/AO transport system kinase
MQNKNFKRKKISFPNVKELANGILNGNFPALSKGITLCESKRLEDRKFANELVKECLPHSGNSIRIGITGVPGVGKSTFIESFGIYLIENHSKKVAVLAVDPSSKRSRGSILGDKTRMNQLSVHPNAFIRPSPSSGALGGVTHHSRESIILCEAAGFDTIIVETVGVGQSEIEVKEMTDFFLLLMLAGAGDDLQGIKRGIMEMTDGMLINKADGDNLLNAKRAKREYQSALHLFPPSSSGSTPKVEICSALEEFNLEKAWNLIDDFVTLTTENSYFEKQRQEQLNAWFKKSIQERLNVALFGNERINTYIGNLEKQVSNREISPTEAAVQVFEEFKKSIV